MCSELEHRFRAFAEGQRLPPPEFNALVEVGKRRFEIDCVWRPQRVGLELDGFAAHGTRAGLEDDRERDRILQAAGWCIPRATWRHLHERPEAVGADLRRLLAMRRNAALPHPLP